MELRFCERVWCAVDVILSISLLLFVSLFLAIVLRCFAMAIDMLRLVICWNRIDGVGVWWEFLDISLHMASMP